MVQFLAVLVAWFVLALSGEQANRQNYLKIQPGMHFFQVIITIGFPGDYRTAPCLYAEIHSSTPYRRVSWMTDSCVIIVSIDSTGKVVRAEWYPRLQAPSSNTTELPYTTSATRKEY
jgi:hypothetical protein